MQESGMWNEEVRLKLIVSRGSLFGVPEVGLLLKSLYKTAWEISDDQLLRHAAKRAPFVCQSQSIILYRERPTSVWLNTVLFSGWRAGLKTGILFLRSGRRNLRWASEDEERSDEAESL
ncbi:hypothetical protein CVT26_005173 [Gymnopilus dilepis]|uniref:Ribonucleotide reductase large subunit C-terminal domain-containing protein n=1 Tax=Gymnopilus dilepis TaxID=231916 RepID=A0A409WWP6_9AGAR|nr:hypothetical protein CVT26_005173 [Gymnopilus dilepis]